MPEVTIPVVLPETGLPILLNMRLTPKQLELHGAADLRGAFEQTEGGGFVLKVSLVADDNRVLLCSLREDHPVDTAMVQLANAVYGGIEIDGDSAYVKDEDAHDKLTAFLTSLQEFLAAQLGVSLTAEEDD